MRNRIRQRLVGVSCAVVTLSMLCATATAQDRRAARTRLTWQAPAGCADERAVRESVAKVAGRDVFVETDPFDYVVRGSMKQEREEWVVKLDLERADGTSVGERELRRSASSCHGLDVPLAVALALMIDLQAQTVDVPKAEAPPPPRVTYRLPPPAVPAWGVAGDLAAVGAVGLFSGPSVGGRLDLGVRYARLSFGATATLWVPSQVRDADGAGVDAQAWQLGPRLCVSIVRAKAWGLDACASAQVGLLTVVGVGFATVQTQSPLFWTASPELALAFGRLGPLRGGLGLGAIVPLGHYRFYGDTSTGPRDSLTLWPVIPAIFLSLGLESTENGT